MYITVVFASNEVSVYLLYSSIISHSIGTVTPTINNPSYTTDLLIICSRTMNIYP